MVMMMIWFRFIKFGFYFGNNHLIEIRCYALKLYSVGNALLSWCSCFTANKSAAKVHFPFNRHFKSSFYSFFFYLFLFCLEIELIFKNAGFGFFLIFSLITRYYSQLLKSLPVLSIINSPFGYTAKQA